MSEKLLTAKVWMNTGVLVQNIHIYANGPEYFTSDQMKRFRRYLKSKGHCIQSMRAPEGVPQLLGFTITWSFPELAPYGMDHIQGFTLDMEYERQQLVGGTE